LVRGSVGSHNGAIPQPRFPRIQCCTRALENIRRWATSSAPPAPWLLNI